MLRYMGAIDDNTLVLTTGTLMFFSFLVKMCFAVLAIDDNTCFSHSKNNMFSDFICIDELGLAYSWVQLCDMRK